MHRSDSSSGSAGGAVRRAPVLVGLAAVLVVGGLLDRMGGPSVNSAVNAEAVQPVPVVAPAGAISSSWFCAGATDSGSNYAAGRVVIANEGAAPVSADVRVVGSDGSSSTTTVTVAAKASTSVPETVAKGAPWTGAIVDAQGGMVAVSQVVDGQLGRSVSPCATSGSQHWYLPAGQTRINVSDTVLLLNPFPTDSIVDLSFVTDQGSENPQDFQSIDVPGNSLVALPLGSHLRRRTSIATTASARTGDIVAWETELVTPPPSDAPILGTAAAAAPLADPASPDTGVSVTLGAPSTGTTWAFPDGLSGDGIDEQYLIYNPGAQTAAVRISVGLQQGSAEPFAITVGPYSETAIVSEGTARIPAGVAHTATVVSTNGVPVVAARSVSASSVTSGVTPRRGIGTLIGERLTSKAWVIPVTATHPGLQGHIVVFNPGTTALTATVAGSATPQTVTVAPAGQASVNVPDGPDAALAVTASEAVYVEYDLLGAGTPAAFSLSSAVPQR